MDNLNYGIIGNCRSAALISEKGSIDWFCLPQFDSASVFAKILDYKKGGSFEIITDKTYDVSQWYIKMTNLIVTRFESNNDVFEIVDFMPRYYDSKDKLFAPPDLVRYVVYVSGQPIFRVKYDPRPQYAGSEVKTQIGEDFLKTYTVKGAYDSVYLYSSFDKKKINNGDEILLKGDGYFLLSYNQKVHPQTTDRCYLKMERTKVYWMNWCERTGEYTKYKSEILRSSLVLKLLSFDKTGAIIAALTTSLPETIGEQRNWDYRYCWLRDSSMVVKIMAKMGHYSITKNYIHFLMSVVPDKDEKIQIMYGIDGRKKITEEVLPHLEGYEKSAPVRIGNDAYKQKQNDIYGIMLDVIYQYFTLYEVPVDEMEDLWTLTRSVVKNVEKNWHSPDRGIWELRTDNRHFTFSKILSWVAADRAIKIVRLLKQKTYIEDWQKLCDTIKEEIFEKAWNKQLNAFTQYYGSYDMDASVLLMEWYGFIDAKDPRFISTVKAVQDQLSFNNLLYRYKNRDDFGFPSSAFTVCTFWLIVSLYRIGEKEEAKKLFEEILKYSNHLGLFSEDIDFTTKRLLGNFPQAYSHLALIETAVILGKEV